MNRPGGLFLAEKSFLFPEMKCKVDRGALLSAMALKLSECVMSTKDQGTCLDENQYGSVENVRLERWAGMLSCLYAIIPES